MTFNSIEFMVFFPVVLAIYFVIPKKLRQFWLLIASYYFYMSWNPVYALLILFSTVITYLCGRGMDLADKKAEAEGENEALKAKTIRKKKWMVAACVAANLLILGIFKYGNFAMDSIRACLSMVHIQIVPRKLDLLLPVGISFYTFQALGYIIDVYRKEIQAEKNLLRYMLFVSFFPQLVAGPIERSKNLLTQMQHISEIHVWNAKRVTSGAILMVWGFFMKMVLADRISIVVDTVYGDFPLYGSTELIFAAILFSIQIYCDFGSYSLIAIGAAKVMGFELMENFNTPYFAISVKDFWSRWHISLSTWFRDYVYIPLGGNRKGRKRKYLNLMVVFLASGLWHGADWSYVVWGALHGFYQVIGEVLSKPRKWFIQKLEIQTDCFSWRLLQRLVTFSLVTFAWIFFRADNVKEALRYIKRIIIRPTPWTLFDEGLYTLGLDRREMNILLVGLVFLFLVDMIRKKLQMSIDQFLMKQNLWFEWVVVMGLILMIVVFGQYGPAYDAKQFIYFQF